LPPLKWLILWIKGNYIGRKEQEILKIIDGERIDYDIRFLKPMKSISRAYLKLRLQNMNSILEK
jgi:hypothetical protein